jgi:hypothetical protein
MRPTTLFFAAVILTAPTLVRAQAPTARSSAKGGADDELRRIEQAYLDARLRNDKAALERLIADNYISIGSSGQMLARSFAIQAANATPGGDSLRSMTIDSVQVRRMGSTQSWLAAETSTRRMVRAPSASCTSSRKRTAVGNWWPRPQHPYDKRRGSIRAAVAGTPEKGGHAWPCVALPRRMLLKL